MLVNGFRSDGISGTCSNGGECICGSEDLGKVNSMLYRDFGKTGWQVSVVGMGTWNIGNQWGELDDATAQYLS